MRSLEITGGRTTGRGGAIYVPGGGGGLTINDSTIHGNVAGDIGGAICSAGSLTIRGSTLTDNISTGSDGQGIGGAIFCFAVATTLSNCTIEGNSASQSGGGFRGQGGTVTLENTIIAGNAAPSGADLRPFGVISNGGNLIGDHSTAASAFVVGMPNANGDFVGATGAEVVPLLAPLGDYGGPTPTMPPHLESPCIDAGTEDPGGADQRGAPRFVNGALDIGAVEFQPTIVTTAVDEDNTGTGLSLREAIASPFSSTITFAPAVSGATCTLSNGQLLIGQSIIIDASALGDGFVVDANGIVTNHRVFEIPVGHSVRIDGLTITGGKAPSEVSGGGLKVAGTLVLNDSIVRDNDGYLGGGIYSSGALTVNRSTISGNSAPFQAGGFFQDGGTSTFTGCTFSGNTTPNNGGAAYIFNSGICTLRNCTVVNNTTTNLGNGGGIMTYSAAQLRLSHTTIANNSARGSGGGIHQGLPDVVVTLENSIVAGNSSATTNSDDLSGSIDSHSGVNLIGNSTGSTGLGVLGTNYLTGDPILAPLGVYGGSTETLPPLPDSPVVDAAGASTVSLDQRGFPRPIGSARDIGAVESLILQGFPENAQNDVTLLPVLDWGDVAGASFEVFFDSGAGLQSIGQTSESSLAVPSPLAS
ncbi:MAG: right-handed parallel beta-helix repeat-containing protein, partial [Verrucomicrobiales bacterium]|nr:right-handed parallel beta-helix repeat-containing protein [Verrucomicrobiales bacterium]